MPGVILMTHYFKLKEDTIIPITVIGGDCFVSVNSALVKIDDQFREGALYQTREGIPYYEQGDMTCITSARPGNTIHCLSVTVTDKMVADFWQWFDSLKINDSHVVSWIGGINYSDGTICATLHRVFESYFDAKTFAISLDSEANEEKKKMILLAEKTEGRKITTEEAVEMFKDRSYKFATEISITKNIL